METAVAAGSTLTGLMEAEHVTIAGEFDGEIRATGRVRISEGARVKGKLAARDAEIAGDADRDPDRHQQQSLLTDDGASEARYGSTRAAPLRLRRPLAAGRP